MKDQGDLIEGDYFTDEQETKGELVAIVRPEGDFDADGDCTKLITTRVEGDKRWVKIQNKEYEVIGYWNCQEKCSHKIPKILDRQESGGVMSKLL